MSSLTLKISIFLLALLLSPIPTIGYIESVQLNIGDEFRIETTDLAAFVEVNGSTTDIFNILPISTNIAIGERGKIAVDEITDDTISDATYITASGSIGTQDISGRTYVNEWYTFFNSSLYSTVTNVTRLDRDNFEFKLPDSTTYSVNDQQEPPPLFSSANVDYYNNIDNNFPELLDALIDGIEYTTHTLEINTDSGKFKFELDLIMRREGVTNNTNWDLNGTIICNTKVDISKSLVTSYYIKEEFVYSFGDAYWKKSIVLGFEKYSQEAGLDFPIWSVLAALPIMILFIKRRKSRKNII